MLGLLKKLFNPETETKSYAHTKVNEVKTYYHYIVRSLTVERLGMCLDRESQNGKYSVLKGFVLPRSLKGVYVISDHPIERLLPFLAVDYQILHQFESKSSEFCFGTVGFYDNLLTKTLY